MPEECPCGSTLSYAECCGPLHRGEAEAPTPEALMRARYSAFVVGDGGFLLSTWSPATRPANVEIDPGMQWRRLQIDRVQASGDEGRVDFVAHYWDAALRTYGRQTEHSVFRREDGRWYYLGEAA